MTGPTRSKKLANSAANYTETPEAREITQALGWRPEMHPIKACDNGKGTVLCSGTAIKPDEWQTLIWDAPEYLADGRPVYVVNVPKSAWTNRRTYKNADMVGMSDDEIADEIEAMKKDEDAHMRGI